MTTLGTIIQAFTSALELVSSNLIVELRPNNVRQLPFHTLTEIIRVKVISVI